MKKAMLLISTLVLSPLGTAALAGQASDPLFSPPELPFVAPGRLFAVKIPSGWQSNTATGNPNIIEFRNIDRPGGAAVVVQRFEAPSGSSPRQLLLKSIEQRLSKLPRFQIMARRDFEIAQSRASSVAGLYYYQGNLEYPRAVEEVALVSGADAFLFHFECIQGASPQFIDDLNDFYGSFMPRPPGLEDGPFAPSVDPIEQIPF